MALAESQKVGARRMSLAEALVLGTESVASWWFEQRWFELKWFQEVDLVAL